MRITRLAATGAAGGAAALALAAPAQAAAEPRITVDPERFRPGDNLTLTVTECATRPVTGQVNQIFAERPAFQKEGAAWTAIGGTKTSLRPGQTYRTEFRCRVGGRTVVVPLETSPAPPLPRPTPTPKPTLPKPFAFGFDKVKLSTRTVRPKGTMTFTVTCPTTVRAESASFAEAPRFRRTSEKITSKGTATFKETLPSIVNIKVICKGHGHVTYSTKPAEDDLGEGGPKIPKGAPDTGGGLASDQGPGPAALG
ncbi:MAG TPA: hypothetical protein VHJ17_09205 [Thermomonospora sp.]|nr:hypothetical protein [Thermomonospora sp.]